MRLCSIFLSLVAYLFFTAVNAQDNVDTDTLEIKLQPFTPDNKFLTPGWHNWGGSIIKGDDGVFRLFYSRWPVEKLAPPEACGSRLTRTQKA